MSLTTDRLLLKSFCLRIKGSESAASLGIPLRRLGCRFSLKQSLLHSDLARLDGFGFWQRYGQDPLFDICGNLRRIDRWSELVDATEIVRTNLAIYQFTGNFDRLPTTQND